MKYTNGVYSVDAKERIGSQEMSYAGNVLRMKRTFDVAWEDRRTFLAVMMGYEWIEPGSQIGYSQASGLNSVTTKVSLPWITRYNPIPADVSIGSLFKSTKLYPTSVDRVEPVGPKKFDPVSIKFADRMYRKARITLSYEGLTYPVKTDDEVIVSLRSTPESKWKPKSPYAPGQVNAPYEYGLDRNVTKIVQPTAEALRLPVGFYQWAESFKVNGSTVANAQVAATGSYVKLQAFADVTYVWHRVPGSIWVSGTSRSDKNAVYKDGISATAVAGLGTVNAYEFDGYPPGTLLLTSVQAQPYRWVTGDLYYDYTFKMKHFYAKDSLNLANRPADEPIGHNYFLRYAMVGSTGNRIEPSYCLITHNGTKTGVPVFRRYDYTYLFCPLATQTADTPGAFSQNLWVDEINGLTS